MGSSVQVGRILIASLLCQVCTWLSTTVSASDIPQHGAVQFDYSSDGPHGPSRWGDMQPAWSLCKEGRRQSPMSITLDNTVADYRLGALDAAYTRKRVPSNISHDGHGVKLSVPAGAGKLKINNVVYRPAQMHFHMPSEHQIWNQSFPLELHLVHFSKDGKIAVVAWLFDHGNDSPFLAQFIDKLPKRTGRTEAAPIVLPKMERSYGRYQGSLTTPACEEKVTWTVMLWNFPTVSDNQLRKLKVAMPHANARPTQSSHGRIFRINSGR